jgi:paraquat-inducible protein A
MKHSGDQSAASLGYAACPICELLIKQTAGSNRCQCPRCESVVPGPRLLNSISRTWALLASATLLLIPANLYPVMTVTRFGQGEPNTIMSGVIHLIEDGAWPLGLLVFFAVFVTARSSTISPK